VTPCIKPSTKTSSHTRKRISNNIAPKLTARCNQNVYKAIQYTQFPQPHILYFIRGTMIDIELISAHGKSFPLGNVIVCTYPWFPSSCLIYTRCYTKWQPSEPTPDPPQHLCCQTARHFATNLVVTVCTATGATAEQSDLHFCHEVYRPAAYDSHNKNIISSRNINPFHWHWQFALRQQMNH